MGGHFGFCLAEPGCVPVARWLRGAGARLGPTRRVTRARHAPRANWRTAPIRRVSPAPTGPPTGPRRAGLDWPSDCIPERSARLDQRPDFLHQAVDGSTPCVPHLVQPWVRQGQVREIVLPDPDDDPSRIQQCLGLGSVDTHPLRLPVRDSAVVLHDDALGSDQDVGFGGMTLPPDGCARVPLKRYPGRTDSVSIRLPQECKEIALDAAGPPGARGAPAARRAARDRRAPPMAVSDTASGVPDRPRP